jgi:hypothetical protein
MSSRAELRTDIEKDSALQHARAHPSCYSSSVPPGVAGEVANGWGAQVDGLGPGPRLTRGGGQSPAMRMCAVFSSPSFFP